MTMMNRIMVTYGVAGAICLPATFELVRNGSIESALAIVGLIGIAAAVVAVAAAESSSNTISWWRVAVFFSIGAFVSQLIGFINYYVSYGYQDQKVGVGIAIAIIQFLSTAVAGSLSAIIATIVFYRMSNPSK